MGNCVSLCLGFKPPPPRSKVFRIVRCSFVVALIQDVLQKVEAVFQGPCDEKQAEAESDGHPVLAVKKRPPPSRTVSCLIKNPNPCRCYAHSLVS